MSSYTLITLILVIVVNLILVTMAAFCFFVARHMKATGGIILRDGFIQAGSSLFGQPQWDIKEPRWRGYFALAGSVFMRLQGWMYLIATPLFSIGFPYFTELIRPLIN